MMEAIQRVMKEVEKRDPRAVMNAMETAVGQSKVNE